MKFDETPWGQERAIVSLQLLDGKLVKTRKFSKPTYVGDALNAVSIFSELEADEIVITAIQVGTIRPEIPFDLLAQISEVSSTPLAYGGGLATAEEAQRLIDLGFEKVVFSTALFENPEEVERAASKIGSQAIVASLDYSANLRLFTRGASQAIKHIFLPEGVKVAENLGAGEILLHSIEKDGLRSGLDFTTAEKMRQQTSRPLILSGGASSREELRIANEMGVSSASGSLFVYFSGPQNVLLNYPTDLRLIERASAFDDSNEPAIKTPPAIETNASVCSRCLITATVPGSRLAESEECHYCSIHDELESKYPTGLVGERALEEFCTDLRSRRLKKHGKYDCVLGVSGGVDSSFLALELKKRGLNPLCVHFDNTWNSPIATENIYKVLSHTGFDLITHVADNEEYDELYRCFLKAGVKDIEAPTDIAFMGVLYRAAEKFDIDHIVEGHSFRTEGVSPLGWLYMDGAYISDVYRKYSGKNLKSFPNLGLISFLKWTLLSQIKRSRPLYWLDYDKRVARKGLEEKIGWKWYGGHHLENRFTAFYHSFFLPSRFHINFKIIELSALVRSGLMERDAALEQLKLPRSFPLSSLSFVRKRLGFSKDAWAELLSLPHRSYREFKTYKPFFEFLAPVFLRLVRQGRVPETFYEKFCSKR